QRPPGGQRRAQPGTEARSGAHGAPAGGRRCRPLRVRRSTPARGGARRWPAARLATWTRQLAALVDSGLPLERALAELAREADDAAQQALVTELRAEVNAGSTLAAALARHPRVFDAPYRAVVAAGEASGRLGTVLQRLADEREAADTLRNTALQRDVHEALALVREGAPLAAALATRPALAGLLVTFARLGEQTGQLGPLLQRAAQQLSDDAQRRLLRLTTWLEPLLIIAMGGVVLLIVLAVMLPIIQLNQLVR
ncbi:type II secretion system F family protein, partial [Tepidimonas sp.]|uniref:type II secretion system F family protein n=1 Tax=Tepidimonas sp. TaxID=2002775 RepID=UPI0039198869